MKKSNHTLLIILLLCIAAIGCYNLYGVRLGVVSNMPTVQSVQIFGQPSPRPSENVYAETYDIIKSHTQKKETASTPRHAHVRNPFLWPEEVPKILADDLNDTPQPIAIPNVDHNGSQDTKKAHPFTLSLVLIGENRNIALLNDSFVTVGSWVNHYRVERIDSKGVMLSGKNGSQELKLKAMEDFLQRSSSRE
jgi:hypothetical protein